jgi:hypothetical protein
VPCPVNAVCGVERCLACPDFVGYVDGAVICHHTLGAAARRGEPTARH